MFQVDFTSSNVLIGFGIIFGFAFLLTFLTNRKATSLFGWMIIFSGFVVYGDLLPSWILILEIVILVFLVGYKLTNREMV